MRTVVRSLLAVFGLVLAVSVGAEVRYRVIDLGEVPGYVFHFPSRITNQTQVLGTAFDSFFFGATAFLWQSDTGAVALPPAGGFLQSFPGGVLPGGQAVGYSSTFGGPLGVFNHATTWDAAHNPSLLGPTPEFSSYAGDIQSDGTIIGQFDFLPALWAKDGSLAYLPVSPDFPFGGANRFNKPGQIIGFTYDPVSFQTIAHFWDQKRNPTVIGRLNPFGWSDTRDINDHGWVVGASGTGVPGSAPQHAYLWHEGGSMQALPGLGAIPDLTYATGINNRMQIVGASIPPFGFFTSAVLWENGQVTDLNSLIDPTLNLFLSTADGINDKGQIVGFGTQNVNGNFLFHAYMLDPI
jgi:uncharacterized membrane protein